MQPFYTGDFKVKTELMPSINVEIGNVSRQYGEEEMFALKDKIVEIVNLKNHEKSDKEQEEKNEKDLERQQGKKTQFLDESEWNEIFPTGNNEIIDWDRVFVRQLENKARQQGKKTQDLEQEANLREHEESHETLEEEHEENDDSDEKINLVEQQNENQDSDIKLR